jgi:hypothetical protein
MIAEKISVNSRASPANASRRFTFSFAETCITQSQEQPALVRLFGTNLHTQKKTFLLKASSASIQLAATDPEARTNCRTSSVLLSVLGNCFTNVRTDSANKNVRSSRSRGLAPSSILGLGFDRLFGIWVLAFGTCGFHRLLRRVSQIVRRDQSQATFFQ